MQWRIGGWLSDWLLIVIDRQTLCVRFVYCWWLELLSSAYVMMLSIKCTKYCHVFNGHNHSASLCDLSLGHEYRPQYYQYFGMYDLQELIKVFENTGCIYSFDTISLNKFLRHSSIDCEIDPFQDTRSIHSHSFTQITQLIAHSQTHHQPHIYQALHYPPSYPFPLLFHTPH